MSIFMSEKEREEDFQPTKPSAPKGKQCSKLKALSLEEYFKRVCSDDKVSSFNVQWIVSLAKSA